LTACAPGSNATSQGSDPGSSSASNNWFNQAEFDQQKSERTAHFDGDPSKPYLQQLPGQKSVPAGKYTASGPQKVCFSNAALDNTWRQTGWITMNQQLKVLHDQGVISSLEARDAQADDDKQVADIDYFISEGDCGAYIIAPNSSKATAPAVQRACDTGKPVIIFDRDAGVDCETSFVHSVGNYAWGIDSGSFIVDHVKKGAHVVALRTQAGVDLFEQRWAAAQHVFDQAGVKYTQYITGADPTKIKNTITDEIAKGDIAAVWVDLGDQSPAVVEAFEDAGKDIPIVTGEDNLAYLRTWKDKGFEGFGAVYPAFQWRTALLAVGMLFQGKSIPANWVLPQQPITKDDLDSVLAKNKGMPDGQWASFGGEDLPGYPQIWQKRVIP